MSNPRTPSKNTSNSGSRLSGEPEFLAVGKLLKPHGVHGEMRLAIWTDFPERLKQGATIYIGQARYPVRIKSVRGHHSRALIAFDELDSRETAARFRNQVIFVRTADLPPLPDGGIYKHQLLGLQVILDEDNTSLGVIAEILETGANDVFLVRPPQGEDLLIPDIDSVILEINLKKGFIRIRPLPGLLPDSPGSP